ncbi:esterase/lipase family protein [Flagellimonas sediminis]|uniref:DUF676 domain-containing protein n=1 Tax=Flagellimonas sediminis TaxID=2696468 RepID=A0A6I5KRM1_9FLAO|nr:putative lipase [Allomuricauda sediminis]NDV43113.1 hypothetical protein [Allomuricauda sediminis]
MEFILNEKKNKHLLILVHGLNGSDSTWRGDNQRFVENLTQEVLVQDYFDLALYTYSTHIFKLNWFSKLLNLIRGFFRNRPHEDANRFNVGIESISRPLVTQINGVHTKYETISFIAHSMGGLVTKSTLTWLDQSVIDKIYFVMSLSVPHIGAELANIGSRLLGGNPQVVDLRSMGAFTTLLNQRFGNISPQPKMVYQYGIYDTVVPQQSAYPPNVRTQLTEATNDDHFSVVLIKDKNNNPLFDRIIRELNIVTLPFLGVQIGIPQGTSFKFIIDTTASRLKFKINYVGFSKSELNTPLRASNVSATNLTDFLEEIGDLTINKIPDYTVLQQRGTLNFTLKV